MVGTSTACPGESNVELVNINGRVFRKTKMQHKNTSIPPSTSKIRDEYSDEQCLMEEDYNIEKDVHTSSYKLTFHLPKIFYGIIIGKSGNTKTKIQNETGATVIIPPPTSDAEDIIIRGPSESSIVSAKTRIDILTESALQYLPYTHFLSIPLNDIQLQQKIQAMYTDLTSRFGTSIQGFDRSILVDPAQFHLTILMLKLYTPEALFKATKLLKEHSRKLYDIVGSRSVLVRLQGLEYMNDDPQAVDVLYVKVHPSDGSHRLADVCKHLVDVFYMANLISPQERDVKLHATLINTRYRQEEAATKQADANKNTSVRQAINAIPILQHFGEIDFGTYKVNDIQLSLRGHFDANGYWKCTESVAMP